MGWRLWTCSLALAAACGPLLGCRGPGDHSEPADPILVRKSAIHGDPTRSRPAVVHMEPPVPSMPPTQVAERRSRLKPTPANSPEELSLGPAFTTSAKPVSRSAVVEGVKAVPEDGGPPVPAVQTNARPPAAALEPPPPASGPYARAADYSWLQGVFERHYHGHASLRFCDPTVEDEHGGKVCLGADPRLDAFKEGDTLRVEGELIVENGRPVRAEWNNYPRYRIRSVRLVQSR